MLGLLRQELLSGIKEKAQFDKVKAGLNRCLAVTKKGSGLGLVRLTFE
jgi:hypothetical protein